MKYIIALIIVIFTIPVSIFVMLYGWGITPESWGIIAFGYFWMLAIHVLGRMLEECA